MEQIYYWIGLSVFWLSATIGSVIIVSYLLKELLNYLGKKFKILWVMVEFVYYKKDFIEWVKDRPNGIGNANKMPMRYHEDICVFYKKLPTYTKQYIQRSEGGLNRVKYKVQSGFKDTDTNNHKFGLKEISVKYDDAKILGSVIDVKKDSPSILIHPTQKPVELFETLIKMFTNENDLILDNCAGSGTTGIACLNTKRQFILMEQDPNYFEKIKKRVGDFNKNFKPQTLFGNEM